VAVHMSNRPPPPMADETIPARRWLEKTQETLFWLPKRLPRGPAGVAIGVGGLLAVVGIVIGVAAAFSGGEGEPAAAAAAHSAQQTDTMTVTSLSVPPATPAPTAAAGVASAAAPSTVAQAAPPAPVERPAPAARPPSDPNAVPVISVDNLPQAPSRGATGVAAAAARSNGNGHLSLVSSTACQISIDGVSRGTTPLMSVDLGAGVHHVECVSPAGKSKSANIAVVEGGSTHYAFTLEP
jgi:hypothetical protein